MTQNRQTPAAAPPDDGGHLGSYTTPDQELEIHAADRPPAAPALNRDLDRHPQGAVASSPVQMLLAALVFFAITGFFLIGRC
jgi:hypothetical protein